MALGRRLQADMNSAEVEQLVRTVNVLVQALENLGVSITAGATAEEALQALSDGIAVGVDGNPNGTANVVSTGAEIVGLNLINSRVRPGSKPGQQLEDLDLD